MIRFATLQDGVVQKVRGNIACLSVELKRLLRHAPDRVSAPQQALHVDRSFRRTLELEAARASYSRAQRWREEPLLSVRALRNTALGFRGKRG